MTRADVSPDDNHAVRKGRLQHKSHRRLFASPYNCRNET